MDNGAEYYKQFIHGSDEAFARIIEEYKDGLILYLNQIVGDIDAAEELAEDTFVRIIIRKPYLGGRSRFKTWLYAIGRNIAIDFLRRRKMPQVDISKVQDIPDEAEMLERSYIRKERDAAVRKALGVLKAEYRRVLWLVYFEDFSVKEAAFIMKKSVHSTETLIYRARKALKAQLEKEGFNNEEH